MPIPDYEYQQRAAAALSRLSNVRVRVIGKSLCRRNIYAVTVGRGVNVPLIAAGFHGMEYLTVLTAFRFARECAEQNSRGVVIVPCVNPDGTEISLHGAACACRFAPFVTKTGDENRWQSNARGVDINHNFAADWRGVKQRERAAGVTQPGATRFGGTHPESEPETRALTRLCRNNRFSRVMALHSQGREIYWDFGKCTPKECFATAQKMGEVSGYTVAAPEPIATGGGFKDWFIQTFHRCGFTAEMGLGKNPLPLSDFEAEYPAVERMLRVFITDNVCFRR